MKERVIAMKIILPLCLALSLPLAAQDPKPRNIAVVNRETSSYLGVYTIEVDSEIAKAAGLKEERGVRVTKVESDSPAAQAGLQESDIILEYNGQRVEGTAHFMRLVAETPAGRKVALGIFRNGSMQNIFAQIGTRPSSQDFSFLFHYPTPPAPPAPPRVPVIDFTMPDIPSGLLGWQSSTLGYMAEPVDGQLAEFFGVKEGVLVRSVTAKSPAEKAGLKAGDVITKADGTAIRSPREITGLLRRQGDKRKISLTIVRAHKEMTLELIAKNETITNALVL